MKNTINIHETAFVTATYRSSDEALSRDTYSRLWANAKTDQWIERYVQAVSREEPFVHCLRNRYFLDTIKRLVQEDGVEALINFGSGFSMYPYLLPEGLLHIEIDQPELIAYKSNAVGKWTASGLLPDRQVHYISEDFNSGKSDLKEKVLRLAKGKRSFILLEGVLFFLSRENTTALFQLFDAIQEAGDFIGSVSFIDEIENTACFKRLIDFYKKEVKADRHLHQTLPTSFYSELASYSLLEHEDYVSLSEKYAPDRRITNGDMILNEHMYIIKKQS